MRAVPLVNESLFDRYLRTRATSEALCQNLENEDFVVQSMPDCSPVKWHLAHTSWFFEKFILETHLKNYHPKNPHYTILFNSYYDTISKSFERAKRGVLSRPTVKEIFEYRAEVDRLVGEVMHLPETAFLIELGCHHEEQHQELMLMDILYTFSLNPLKPAYGKGASEIELSAMRPLSWIAIQEGMQEVGADKDSFAYDHEKPKHRAFLPSFDLANRLVNNAEYGEFIEDQGYRRSELWLSDGWKWVQENKIETPLYWSASDSGWREFSLRGDGALHPHSPVSHLSYYEADAFARWRGVRLPREEEWEVAVRDIPLQGSFLESGALRARSLSGGQFFGELWQWTQSAFLPYPGYRPWDGNLGEYNGKFMSGQMVLRGGSFGTPRAHFRKSYRNFFQPHTRWHLSGLRLARDL